MQPPGKEIHGTKYDHLQRSNDAALLARPEKAPPLSTGQLELALRLALLCTSRRERLMVALYAWHGLPLAEIASRCGVGPARVSELIESLVLRAEAVERTERLGKMAAFLKDGPNYRTAAAADLEPELGE